jgi:hypothetical protein
LRQLVLIRLLIFLQLWAEGSVERLEQCWEMADLISSTASGMLRTGRGKERMPVPWGMVGRGDLKERLMGRWSEVMLLVGRMVLERAVKVRWKAVLRRKRSRRAPESAELE